MRRRLPIILVLLGMITAPFLTGCEIDEDHGHRDWHDYHHYDHHDYDRDRDWR